MHTVYKHLYSLSVLLKFHEERLGKKHLRRLFKDVIILRKFEKHWYREYNILDERLKI